MAAYGIATGLREDTCNEFLRAFYERNYAQDDSVFRLDGVVADLKLGYTLDVKEPPRLDLSSGPDLLAPGGLGAPESGAAVDYDARCQLVAPDVEVVVDLQAKDTRVPLRYALRYAIALRTDASGDLDIDQDVAVEPLPPADVEDQIREALDASGTQDDGLLTILVYVIEQKVLPLLADKMRPMLQHLPLPTLEFEGMRFEDLSLSTQQQHLVAAGEVTAAAPGLMAAPAVPLPDGALFALVTPEALQKMLEIQVGRQGPLKDGEEGKWGPFSYRWSYHVAFSQPQVSFQGTDVHVTLKVDARGSGGTKMWPFPWTEIPLRAKVVPAAAVKASLVISEQNRVRLVASTNKIFTIRFEPAGNVAQWITGAFITSLLNMIATPLGLAVTAFVKKAFNFDVFDLPDQAVTIQGTTLTLRPRGVRVVEAQGTLAATGRLEFA